MNDPQDFARGELDGFFRRREERGRFYCADCLTTQLTQRGAQGIFSATWAAAIEDAFERPGSLHVEPARPCAACGRWRRCIGALPPGS